VREQFRAQHPDSSEFTSSNGSRNWIELNTTEVSTHQLKRFSTGISELNRVLGGGLVTDSFTMIGGDPGIGKSTLLLQMAKGVCAENPELKMFYVSGEESIDQIRGRASRLGIRGTGQIFLGAETQLEKVLASVKELGPQVLVMDSIQTFATHFTPSAPGSVTQIREVTARLMALAKSAGIAVWLVGHVTKDGSIAGPKTVEHMVDTVLYFEGEAGQSYRLLRTVKNRFGSTQELGVFEMDGEGLREITNPSSLFLSERTESISGTAVAAPLEGTRPLLVELQALVTASGLAVPRRTSVGIDSSRISLIAAILEKHMKLPLAEQDLFFNVAGGLKVHEPACDLAAAAAIWSSSQDNALPLGSVFIGELGLTGEVRRVSQIELRIEEATRQGFKKMIIPKNTPKPLMEKLKQHNRAEYFFISRIEELKNLFS
jgi:DNA repair protein RadA/Sms